MPLPKVIIERPPLTPPKFGVLSAAFVRDETDPHAAAGVQWDQEFCEGAHLTAAACYTTPLGLTAEASDEMLRIQFGGSGPSGSCGDITVDWGDGNVEQVPQVDLSNKQHIYDDPGTYTVTGTTDGPCNVNFTVGPFTLADPPGDPDPHAVEVTGSYVNQNKSTEDRAGWVESYPVALYHLSYCRLPGTQDRVDYAKRALTNGESRGIEEHIQTLFSNDLPDGSFVNVLDSGAAASWTVALARIEKYAYQNFSSVPVIYMAREVALVLLADGALEVKGDKLLTLLGSPVIAGTGTSGFFPGFPLDVDSDAGETFIFATGTLVVTRQPITTTDEVINDSAGVVFSNTGITNEYVVLAERQVSVGWECGVVAHRVLAVADGNFPSQAVEA